MSRDFLFRRSVRKGWQEGCGLARRSGVSKAAFPDPAVESAVSQNGLRNGELNVEKRAVPFKSGCGPSRHAALRRLSVAFGA
jgi:hypothetical protein